MIRDKYMFASIKKFGPKVQAEQHANYFLNLSIISDSTDPLFSDFSL